MTDWRQIVALHDQLVRIQPSPVVHLNRTVAVAERDGPEAGLALINAVFSPVEIKKRSSEADADIDVGGADLHADIDALEKAIGNKSEAPADVKSVGVSIEETDAKGMKTARARTSSKTSSETTPR